MINQAKTFAQLTLEEGKRYMAYDDATSLPVPSGGKCKGNLTVGVGRNLDANPLTGAEQSIIGHDGRTKPLTESQVMMLLENDVAAACSDLDDHLPWWKRLDGIRARVLVDMCFNLGITGLMKFKHFLSCLHAGEYDSAARELEDSLWFKQVGTRGPRLRDMIKTGEDYTA